jgi:type IV secretory pathway TrbF-like protein/sugar phosphate permease
MRHRYFILVVFVPFVCGYYISYVFRTIVAVIASRLSSDLELNASDIGILTSVYFLTFALAQLPLGFILDRHGPRRVQSGLLLIAAGGAALFGFGHSFGVLVLSRALIGLGVSGAFMAGLKAIVLWFPVEKVPLVNGWFVMLGGLGAVTATGPTEALLNWVGWRDLFKLLGIITAMCAFAIYVVVPEHPNDSVRGRTSGLMELRNVYVSSRFWRLAPLSASSIGAAWALQGFWAAAWLSDVEQLNRSEIVEYLFVMAVALSVGALVLGTAANFLRQYGFGPRVLLASTIVLFIFVQLCLIVEISLSPYLIWTVVGCISGATVLSYAVLAESFPKESIGRANAGLNVLHVGAGFAIQLFIGIVIQHWTNKGGHYPPIAYRTAFLLVATIQCVGLVWFILPASKVLKYPFSYITCRMAAADRYQHQFKAVSLYDKAIEAWEDRLRAAQTQIASWRLAALGSITVAFLLGVTFVRTASDSVVTPYPIAVEHLGTVHTTDYAKQSYRPLDALIAYFIARFFEDIRSLSMDPVVVYSRWLRAYRYLTERGARTLNDYTTKADPFSKIGIETTAVEIVSIVRDSANSFEARWKETTREKQGELGTEQFTGAVTIVFKTSDTPEVLRDNPLGLYIHGLNWSRDFRDEDTSR